MADAGYWGPEAIIYSTNGDPARDVAMSVKDAITEALVPLYADAQRAVALPNPVRTDKYGNLSFYIDPGTYEVSVDGSDYEFTIVIPSTGGSSGGSGGSFEFVQNIPQSVWSVSHNLGYRPAGVSLFSLDFVTQYDEFSVQHVSSNQLLISMDVPTAGRALM